MKKDIDNQQKDNFLQEFEDWHSRKYSDEYRFGNKPTFF